MTTNETDTSRATREREIFEAGFAACLGYGDNVAHHRGEQAARIFNKAMERIDTYYPATEPPQAPAGLPWRKGGKLGGEMPGDGRIYLRVPTEYPEPYGGSIRHGRAYIDFAQGIVDWMQVDWWLPASELTATIPTPHPTDQE